MDDMSIQEQTMTNGRRLMGRSLRRYHRVMEKTGLVKNILMKVVMEKTGLLKNILMTVVMVLTIAT